MPDLPDPVGLSPQAATDATPPATDALMASPLMASALAARDIGGVYRLLNSAGVSQREISRRTGQSQSEVSEIIGKGRQVMAYDVLVRICEGLQIPRAAMGLAFNFASASKVDSEVNGDVGEDEDMKRRNLMRHGMAVLVGESFLAEGGWLNYVSAPSRLERAGKTDVAALVEMTSAFRSLDRRYGGMGVVETVQAVFARGDDLMVAASTELVRKKLAAALADLGTLAAWVANDVNLADVARVNMVKTLDYANFSGERAVISHVLRVVGRIEAHRGDLDYALKFLQLAEVDAQGDAWNVVKADQTKL